MKKSRRKPTIKNGVAKALMTSLYKMQVIPNKKKNKKEKHKHDYRRDYE